MWGTKPMYAYELRKTLNNISFYRKFLSKDVLNKNPPTIVYVKNEFFNILLHNSPT